MVEVRPFRGLRYDPDRVRGDDVIAPPYDVVGADDEAALLARSPFNAAHLECCPGDEATRYDAAAAALRAWIDGGVLHRDERPACYVYEQHASIQGTPTTRRAFFCALRLHRPEEGLVRPHEATMTGPREQRLRLLRATRANISPIFAAFPDASGAARRVLDAAPERPPALVASDARGDRHRLWVIDDADEIAALAGAVAPANVTIADGHHRYATALTYLDERLAANPALPADAPERFVLAGLIPDDDRGLVILPNHRLVRAALPADLLTRLAPLYRAEAQPGWDRAATEALWARVTQADGTVRFGLVDPGRRSLTLLVGDRDAVDAAMPQRWSPASRALAARVLTETILRPHLGIDEAAMADERQVAFTASVDDAFARAERGGQAAFLLNPTAVSEVSAVADAGELMPQKTTFYYPKLATGMVFRSLE